MVVENLRPLKILIHGDYGDGKSWLGQTTPAGDRDKNEGRLVLDAEGGSEFGPSRKVLWANLNDPPPDMTGFDTCVVIVREMRDVERTFQWLQRGQHNFLSVTIDSLSELQKRLIDEVAGTKQMQQQEWGKVFREGEATVRKFRDLVANPVKPLLCVCYLTGMSERGRGEIRVGPYVQGQLGTTLPGLVDIVANLKIEDTGEGEVRRLYVHQQRGVIEDAGGKTVPWRMIAKDRTHTFRDGVIDVTWREDKGWANNVETMMRQITDTYNTRREAS